MTIRSTIRPLVYEGAEFILKITLYAMIGVMLLTIIVVLSFYWIPLAFWLWFEEKPVYQGLIDWFLNQVLNLGAL